MEKKNIGDIETNNTSEIAKNNPLGGAIKLGNTAMEVAKVFGIEKREIGRMLLTGKLEFPGMGSKTTAQRKKLEVAVDQIIKLAWTMFGIFMIFQIFLVVVGVIT